MFSGNLHTDFIIGKSSVFYEIEEKLSTPSRNLCSISKIGRVKFNSVDSQKLQFARITCI